MEGKISSNTQEKNPKVVVVPPAVETLLEIDSKESYWPEDVKNNESLKKEAEARKKALESMDKITKNIPADLEIAEALGSGVINTDDLSEVYRSLTELFQSDPLNSRLILYLPFELLPPTNWSLQRPELMVAAENFTKMYVQKWQELLSVGDVRENFSEGDVLELELRGEEELERVVKAAHLIPKLVEKGLLSVQDVLALIENNPDTMLEGSVIDVLPVLVDMGFMTQDELDQAIESYDVDLNYRKPKVVPEYKVTENRAKWLQDKDLPVTMNQNSAELIDKPFEDREWLIQDDVEEIQRAVESIQSNSELSRFIYPVSILFGSRIKGYGDIDADIDIAIFVRPEVKFGERNKLKEMLSQTFSHDKIKGKVVEFWIENMGEKFGIFDFEDSDSTLADSSWAHVLFEGSWIGDEIAIKELYKKLLSEFLYSKDKIVIGGDARTIWLEEMEKDTLQYRLMHKGYTRLFPKQGGIQTEHSGRIDGRSAFYDSGYRRLATKLYLSKVFLPQLEKTE